MLFTMGRLITSVITAVCILQSDVLAQVVAPVETAVRAGHDAMFTCQVPSEGQVFKWSVHSSEYPETLGKELYRIGDPPLDNDDYAVNGSYNLIVKQAALSDGGDYVCTYLLDNYQAPLVVLDDPMLTELSDMRLGDTYNITCKVRYGGPSFELDGFPTNIKPMLSLTVGDSVVHTNPQQIETDPAPASDFGPYTVYVMASYTVRLDGHGKMMKCTAKTTQPMVEVMTHRMLYVIHPPTDFIIEPKQSEYFVGGMVNCSASAYPVATFRWVADLSGDPRPRDGHVLKINSEMIGQNEWRCEAVYNGEAVSTDAIAFTVSSNPNPGAGTGGDDAGATSSSSGAWKIAVGILIPVVFIIVLVVVGYFMWYKKRGTANNFPEKQGSGVDNKAADPTNNSHKPTSAHYQNTPGVNNNPDKQGGHPAVSTNPYPPPNPAFQSGRDSPGFADLGAGPIRASNPDLHLDVSFDKAEEGNHSFSIQPEPGYDNRTYHRESPQQQGRQALAPHYAPHDPNTQV